MENKWITIKQNTDERCVIFTRSFKIKSLNDVTLNITALGLYKAFINGKEITKKIFTPGLTVYQYRLMYQSYDITSFLKQGINTLMVYVASGWAIGKYGLNTVKNWMGDRVALNLEVLQSGKQLLCSDKLFAAKESFISFSDIYDGEIQDYSKTEFNKLDVVEVDKDLNLVPNEGEDVLEMEVVKPISLITTPKGEKVIDFGQNLTGYISLLQPKKGHYRFNFGEMLDKDGNFYNKNYRGIKNTIEFIVGDKPLDVIKPWFTFQGYRYALIEKWPEEVEIDINKIQSIVIYSNIERLSYFKCDNPKINQLYSNIIWGQKDNFLDIPTDCPQRDERLGWLGDAGVFSRTACYNFKCDKFFDKWLKDVELEQTNEGAIRGFVPHVLKNNGDVSPGWGDACAIIPFEVYDAYNNKDILAKYLNMMRRWVEYMHKYGPEEFLWLNHPGFGDWLAFDLPAGNLVGATQNDFISSAYFYKTTKMVADIEAILGLDNSTYLHLSKKIKNAFRKFFIKDGLPILNYTHREPNPEKPDIAITQTSLSMILSFGLYEGEDERKLLAKTLNELVVKNGYKLTTGFLGTPLLLPSLSNNGYIETAVELLLQEQFPSWLYSVNRGATTIWEHWDGFNEKGEFWSETMNSFNHYSFGAVFSWVVENIIGLKRIESGYKKIAIKPHYDKRIGNTSFSIKTVNGMIKISNEFKNDKLVTSYEADKNIEVVDLNQN